MICNSFKRFISTMLIVAMIVHFDNGIIHASNLDSIINNEITENHTKESIGYDIDDKKNENDLEKEISTNDVNNSNSENDKNYIKFSDEDEETNNSDEITDIEDKENDLTDENKKIEQTEIEDETNTQPTSAEDVDKDKTEADTTLESTSFTKEIHKTTKENNKLETESIDTKSTIASFSNMTEIIIEEEIISTISELDLSVSNLIDDNISTTSDLELLEIENNLNVNISTDSNIFDIDDISTISEIESTVFGAPPAPITDSEKYVFTNTWWQDAMPGFTEAAAKGYITKINISPMGFGSYYQSSNGKADGKSAIKWKILDKSHEDKTLIISEKILYAQNFGLNVNDKYPGWAGSSVRASLNNETDGFLAHAFTEKEREKILTTTVHTSGTKNQYGNIFSGGPDTQDKIFILSHEEANQYFGYGEDNNSKRVAVNTGFVNADYWRHDLPGEGEAFRYWLRNPAYYVDNQQAKTVEYNGHIDYTFGDTCTYANGVRPAMWVNFNYKLLDDIDTSKVIYESPMLNQNNQEVGHFYYMEGGTLEIKTMLGYNKVDADAEGLFSGFTYTTEINGLEFLDTSAVTNMSKMFYNDTSLTNIGLGENFGKNCVNFESMFENTKIVKMPNGLDTSKGTNLKRMFANCTNLNEFNIASISFATSNVDCQELLLGCASLETILVNTNVRGLPANVTATDMFKGCVNLKGGGGFRYVDTIADGTYARVDYGGIMPGYFTCTDESIFDSVNLNIFSDWANGINKSQITKIKFVNDEVMEDIDSAFEFTMSAGCYGYLKDNDKTIVVHFAHQINKLKTGNTWENFFSSFTNLETIEGLGNIDTYTVTTMKKAFYNCASLRTVDLGDIDFTNTTDTSQMFEGCSNLQTIYVADNFYKLPASVTTSTNMFYNCDSLVGGEGTNYSFVLANGTYARVDYGGILPGYFTLKGTEEEIRQKYANAIFTLPNDWYHGYLQKSQITKIKFYNDENIGQFNEIFTMSPVGAATESVAYLDGNTVKIHFGRHIPKLRVNSDWSSFFKDFSNLTTIEGFNLIDTTNVTKINDLFSGCTSLTSITFETDMPNVTEMERVFYNCQSLQNVVFNRKLNLDKVTTLESAFEECSSLTTLNIGIASLSSIQNLKKTFKNCNSLTTFSFDICDTPTLNDTTEMFSGCSNLSKIYVSNNFQGLNIANSTDMFAGCNNLVGGQGFSYNTSFTSGEYGRVDYGGIMPGYYTLSGSQTEVNEKYKNAIFNLPNTWSDNLVTAGVQKANVSKIKFYNSPTMDSPSQEFYIDSNEKTYGYYQQDPDNVGKYIVKIHFGFSLPYLKVGNDFSAFFKDFTNLTAIEGINLLNLEEVENMSELFSGCSSITNISFNPNTKNVTNMSKMFYGCTNLTTLALGNNFSLEKVTDLSSAFEGCSNLSNMNIGTANFKTVENLNKTFKNCTSLTTFTFDISETASLNNCAEMFSGCTNLTTIYVKDNFQGLNGITRDNMFEGCTNLVGGQGFRYDETSNPDASNGVYGRVDYGGIMPGYFTLTNTSKYNETIFNLPKNWFNPPAVSGITKDNISKIKFYNDEAGIGSYNYTFNISYQDRTVGYLEQDQDDTTKYIAKIHFGHSIPKLKVGSDFSSFFKDFTSLKELIGLDKLNLNDVININDLFSGCSSLESINFNPAIPNVKYMDRAFKDCTNLQSVVIGSNLGLSNVESFANTFENCSSLTTFNLGNASLSKVATLSNAFKNCTSLTSFSLNLGNSNALYKTDGMFSGCSNLISIDATKFNMTNVSTVKEMFSGCINLTTILASATFDTQMASNYEKMFYNCSSLTSINGIKFNNTKRIVKTMKSMFEGCTNLSNVDFSNINTQSIEIDGMSSMFKDCSNLQTISFGDGFRLGSNSSGNNISYMFSGCNSLTVLDLSTFEKENETLGGSPVINVTDTFKNCTNLKTIIAKTNFVSPTAVGTETFLGCDNLEGGAGTRHDTAGVNASSYAHIDEGNSNPGYFTGDIVIITYLGGDGATGSMDVQMATKSEPLTLKPNQFTKSGFSFVNWKDQNGRVYTTTIANPTKSLTLTAQWRQDRSQNSPSYRGGGGGGSGGSFTATNLSQTISFIDDTLITENDSKWVLNNNGERIALELRKDSALGKTFLTDAIRKNHYTSSNDENYIRLTNGMYNVSYLGSNFYFGFDNNGNLMTGFCETTTNITHIGINANIPKLNQSGKEKYYLYTEIGPYKGIRWQTPITIMNVYYEFDQYGRVIKEMPVTEALGTSIIFAGQSGTWEYNPVLNIWYYFVVDINNNKQYYKNGTYIINYLGENKSYTFDEYGRLIK